ncbi:MAG: hypothetical protein U9M94_02370 [Patescibacteria group bacterium]|nr:hypothetical protein [Patescibacteria group bacterium]
MPKRIKRQIKKSMPFFIIISLIISSTAMGLFFNIDYNIYNFFNNSESPVVSLPEAQATDTASTTVEVQNAPPSMSGHPIEVPASTSTSPINIGDTLTITVEASDGESNSYYLIICSSNSIEVDQASGTNHHCSDITFGSSTLTASGVVATTTFAVDDPSDDPGAETDEWYAFVCDNHATQADCSSHSQGASPGSGDNSSPFYINHAPSLASVSTTDDNKDPGGGDFTITAVTTDSDVMGGLDELTLYICGSIGWDVSTGCTGSELCHSTSTTPNVSCTFATGTPAIDADYEYYAYVKDQHDFAAADNYATSTYTVNNVAPEVGSVVINGGVDIVLNMKNMDEYLATTSSTAISDNNGCEDIVSATSTIYWSSATAEHGCTQDDDDCYPIASTYCTILSGSCEGSSDVDLTYTCSTTLAYHAIPTDESSGNTSSSTNWLAGITVFDDDGAYGTATSVSGVDVATLTALDVTEDAIPYLTIKSGENSGDYNATTTIANYGNSPLDAGVDVDDMDKDEGPANDIKAENQQFATSTFAYGSGTWSVEQASSTLQVDTDTVKPATGALDISDEVYWGIYIPVGKPSGAYTGMNTFTAILDSDNW